MSILSSAKANCKKTSHFHMFQKIGQKEDFLMDDFISLR